MAKVGLNFTRELTHFIPCLTDFMTSNILLSDAVVSVNTSLCATLYFSQEPNIACLKVLLIAYMTQDTGHLFYMAGDRHPPQRCNQ